MIFKNKSPKKVIIYNKIKICKYIYRRRLMLRTWLLTLKAPTLAYYFKLRRFLI